MYDTAVAMAKRLLVDSIWKSANLEGLGTTFPKTEAILANAPTNTKAEEVLFIVNMKRAWEFLLDNIDADNNIAFMNPSSSTREMIQNLKVAIRNGII